MEGKGIWGCWEIRVDWDGLEGFWCIFKEYGRSLKMVGQVKDIFLHCNLCHTSCLILIPAHTQLKWSLPFCLFHWRKSIAILLTRGLRVENLLRLCGSDSSRFALIQFAVPSCGARRTEKLISRRSHSSITNARRKNGKHAPNVQSPSHVCPASRCFKLMKEKKEMCENTVKKEGQKPSFIRGCIHSTSYSGVRIILREREMNNEYGTFHE